MYARKLPLLLCVLSGFVPQKVDCKEVNRSRDSIQKMKGKNESLKDLTIKKIAKTMNNPKVLGWGDGGV
jgi:hypothetical protein